MENSLFDHAFWAAESSTTILIVGTSERGVCSAAWAISPPGDGWQPATRAPTGAN